MQTLAKVDVSLNEEGQEQTTARLRGHRELADARCDVPFRRIVQNGRMRCPAGS